MFKNNFFYLFLAVFLISSCSNNQVKYENTEALVADAKTNISTISVSELNLIVSKKGKYMLIDCREEEEFAESHIKGAINIPRGKIEFSNKLPNKNTKVYIYSNNSNRAALAGIALKKIKFSDVFVLDGGLFEWTKIYSKAIEKSSDTEEEDDDSC